MHKLHFSLQISAFGFINHFITINHLSYLGQNLEGYIFQMVGILIGNSPWGQILVLRVGHFPLSIQHPFTSSIIYQVFMDQIFFKLHGMIDSIVMDCDPTFTIKFWQE